MDSMPFYLLLAIVLVGAVAFAALLAVLRLGRRLDALPSAVEATLEARHRQMLTDLREGLASQAERIAAAQAEGAERLRTAVSHELAQTRGATEALALRQGESLAANRQTLVEQLGSLARSLGEKQDALKAEMLGQTLTRIAEQGRADQQLMQNALTQITAQLSSAIGGLTQTTDQKLAEIGGRVSERLDEGFKRTNETFANVMARLATIDEAQKKIDGLTTNVVSLQELLGDKRSRGAFGEMQLETIVRNLLPESAFEFQYTFTTRKNVRADCVLKLPEPTGLIAVDSKFPLENFERMYAEGPERATPAAFKADVKRHVDDIAAKYIVPGETGDGAVMFVPAEAVFAEIHARHRDLVEYAQARHVWIVSPTTLMAVLNTARAVIKDVETRRQVHIIQDELGKLGKDFARFDERMRKLADHIRQANDDAQNVAVSSRKISDRFARIERVELEETGAPRLTVVDGGEPGAGGA